MEFDENRTSTRTVRFGSVLTQRALTCYESPKISAPESDATLIIILRVCFKSRANFSQKTDGVVLCESDVDRGDMFLFFGGESVTARLRVIGFGRGFSTSNSLGLYSILEHRFDGKIAFSIKFSVLICSPK